MGPKLSVGYESTLRRIRRGLDSRLQRTLESYFNDSDPLATTIDDYLRIANLGCLKSLAEDVKMVLDSWEVVITSNEYQ